MNRILVAGLLLFFVVSAYSQPKTRGKVKRKYRQVERVSEILPQVLFRGIVRDINKTPIPGASIEFDGVKRLVHSNSEGEFMISDLPVGRMRLRVSSLGYWTKTSDFELKPGYNDYYIALDREVVHLENLFSTARKREQKINDIPASVKVINNPFSKFSGNVWYYHLAHQIPGLNFYAPASARSGFILNGQITQSFLAGEGSPVAFLIDEIPYNSVGGGLPLMFDVERVEVLKGPQNVLFGENAWGGVIHQINTVPKEQFGGYVSVSGGSFEFREAQTALNVPLIEDKLLIRAAAHYSSFPGNIKNTSGGRLQGNNGLGGRLAIRFIPNFNHNLDVSLTVIDCDFSGTTFLNPWALQSDLLQNGYNHTNPDLTLDHSLGSDQQQLNSTLNYKFFLNEHDYFTLISAFTKYSGSDRYDADGTEEDALYMYERNQSALLYNELRYNFSVRSRLNGSTGVAYSSDKTSGYMQFSSNDVMIYSLLSQPENFRVSRQSRLFLSPGSLNPFPMDAFQLTNGHQEGVINDRNVGTVQGYLNSTYRLTQRLFFSMGLRGFYDKMQIYQESVSEGVTGSELGKITGTYPNLFYLPSAGQKYADTRFSLTGQAGFTFRRNENFNIFINAIRGRKPQVLQFSWNSNPNIISESYIHSAEAGWKAKIRNRVYWDITGYYREYTNLHTINWSGSEEDGIVNDKGNGISYGAEINLKIALVRGIELFGSYEWLESQFNTIDVDGNEFIYGGNRFPYSPRQSFSIGTSLNGAFVQGLKLFITPRYYQQSHTWLTEANISGLDQPTYGILNVNAGLELENPGLVLLFYGVNLLDQQYLTGAGNRGGLIGLPTVAVGLSRFLGTKLTWSF